MKNKSSIIAFLTLSMFISSAFAFTKNPDRLNEGDTIGFPFTIYKSELLASESVFSIIGLLGNLFVFVTIAYLITFCIEKMKTVGANRNLRTYP